MASTNIRTIPILLRLMITEFCTISSLMNICSVLHTWHFLQDFSSAHSFHTALLLILRNYSTCIFIWTCTSIWCTRVLDLCTLSTHKISWAHEPLIIEEIVKTFKSHFKQFTSSWNCSFTFLFWNYSVQTYYNKSYEKWTHVKMS